MNSVAHTRQVTVTRIICGVDIASKSLEARIGRKARPVICQQRRGHRRVGRFLPTHQVELVAMEATGGYEQQAFAQLSEQGLPVAILNPRSVRQFAQSMGWLEKTDRIDAGMIAWYAEVKKSRPLCLAPSSQQHLRALVTRLRQLTEMRTAQLNQQRLVTEPRCRASFKELLAVMARQIRELEQRIAALHRDGSAVAGTRSGLPHHQGRGRPHGGAADGGDAGDRYAVQQDHLQAGRGRPAGERLRQAPGQASRAWRTRRSA